jgi:monoamine oxidase
VARTPLFDQVVRVFRRLPGGPEAAQGRPQAGAIDRRGLLRRALVGAAGTAALAGAAPRVRAGGGDAAARVVIVGAGLAGLHCAYRLQDLGLTASVYDAATRLGGRVLTDRRTFGPGQHAELGGELIDTGHETMRALAEELEIPLLDYATDAPGLAGPIFYVGGRRLSEAEVTDGFAPIARAIDAALATLRDPDDRFVYYDNANGGAWLDALSVADFLDRSGAAGPVRTLLEVAYTAEFGLEPEASNALNLVLYISTDLERFRIYGESDERFHARPGSDAFTARLAAALPPQQLHLGAALEALRPGADGAYVLTFARGARRFDVEADHVVLALPFTLLREVDLGVALPPVKRRAIAELGYGTNAKLMAGTAARVWRSQGATGESISDRGYQSSWDTSRLQPGAAGILTAFVGGTAGLELGAGTPAAQLERFLEQIDPVFPGVRLASTGRVARMHWPSYPFTRGSYAAYKVGQYTAFAGAEIERVDNLHFCGEHTSLDFQGFMEGAALTGAMAADEVAGDLGLDSGDGVAARALPIGAGGRIRRQARAVRAARRWHAALAGAAGPPAAT